MVLFFERWLAHVHSQISPKSHERYSEIIRKNIIPDLGAVPLTKLRPAQISQAYAKALAGGRRDGKGGLAGQEDAAARVDDALRQAVEKRATEGIG